jgi:hypothetical protein
MKKFKLNADVFITEHYRIRDYEITEDEVDEYCAIYGEDKEEVMENISDHARGIINYLDCEFGLSNVGNYKDSEVEIYEAEVEEVKENGDEIQSE